MPATQQDIATAVGVTRATVSYVFGGRAEAQRISPGVVERIRAAAKRLGYHPHHGARTLAAGRSRRLGLSLPSVDNDFWMRIALGVQGSCVAADYDLLLIAGGERRWSRCQAHLRERRIDALVLIGSAGGRTPGTDLGPVVQVAADAHLSVPQVSLDARPGMTAAVAHLAALGHRQVLWLGPETPSSHQRQALAATAAAAHGMRFDSRLLPWKDYPPGAAIDRQIAYWSARIAPALGACPSSVLCWNDGLALGLYALAAERGWRIPHDLSIIGFDDHHAPAAIPALTTISHRLPELGEAATTLALAMVDGRPGTDISIPATLVQRASVGRAAKEK